MSSNTPDLPHGSSTASTHLPVERRSLVFLFTLIVLTVILAGIVVSAQQLEAHFFVSWLAGAALITLYHLLDDDIRHRFWLWHLLAGLLVTWLTLGLPLALAALGLSLLLATGLWWWSERMRQLTALSWSEMRYLLLIRGATSLVFLLVIDTVYRLSNGKLPLRTLENGDLASVIVIFLVMLGTRFAVSYYFFRVTSQPIITWYLLADGLIFLPAVIILALILYSLGYGVFWFMIFLICIQTIRSHNTRQAQKNHTEFQRKLGVVNAYAPDIMLHGAGHNGLLAACQAAAAVARIEKAAVYLTDTAQGVFRLHTAIGLNPAHKDYISGNIFPIIPRWPVIVQDARQSPDLAAEAKIGGFHSLVNLPIRHDESLLGCLVLYVDQPDYQLGNDLTFLTTLTNYAAKAIENSRTIVELEQYAFETTHLLSLSRALTNLSLDNPENFNYIAATLSQMMDIHWVMLLLWENNTPSTHVLGWIWPDEGDPDERYQMLAQFPEVAALEQQSVPWMQPFRQEDPALSPELAAFMREEGLVRLFFVPLQVQAALVGVILLGATDDRVFTAREERLLEVTSSQITAQLQVARLSQMTHRMLNERGQQLSAIEEIARQISGAKNFNEIIHNVLTSAIRTTQADMAALALVTETGDFWVIIQYYDDQGRLQRKYEAQDKDKGVIGRAIRTGKTITVPNNAQDADYISTPPLRYASSLVVPLIRSRIAVGALNVESVHSGFFTAEQISFLQNLGEHALISIENARLLEELNYQVDTLRSLRELSLYLSSAIDTRSVARAVLGAAMAILHSQNAALFQYDAANDQLTSLWSNGIQNSEADAAIMEQIARQTILTNEIQEIPDILAVEALHTDRDVIHRGIIAVPIIRNNQVTEVLSVVFAEPDFFQARDVSTLSWLASQTARHLENAVLHEQIRNGSNRMKAILDTTRDGVILLDREGRLIESNPAAQKLLGINLVDRVNERFSDLLENIEVSDRERAGYSAEELTNLVRMIRLEPGRIMRRQFERRIPPGEVIYIQEIGSPVFNEKNEITGWLLSLRDITEEKSLEAYRDEITHMVVHDLRGPLASIVSSIKLTEESIPDDETFEEEKTTLSLARESAEDLMDMVNTILDIAKLENKQMPLSEETQPIRELFQNAHKILMSTLQQADIEVEIIAPDNLPLARIDGKLVQRVITNLLDNARRYTPNGGLIQLSAAMHDRNHLIVRIADTGPGIPPGERDRIFEKYRQAQNNIPLRGGKGTGLGLTLCKLVVEAHGGQIWVEDEGPLPGASIAFTLPIE